ncbi:MAG: phosphoglycolate phosphatase [Geminicoccaceae bacterium]
MPDFPAGVVFDLDGTLIESAPDLHLVLSELFAEEGLAAPPLADLRTMIGDGARVLIERGLTAAEAPYDTARLDDLYARFLERYVAEPCRASTVYPGVFPVLDALRDAGARLGICTNKPQRPSELLLQILGLEPYFPCLLGGDALSGIRKPDPRHLTAVLDRLDVPAEQAVMVGDSRNDLITARAAGLPCILFSHGYTTIPAADLGADAVLDHFDELLPALARFA